MTSGNGYKNVSILTKNKQYTKYIHRLVAIAFIPNTYNKLEVNHIDGNTMNNDVSNLEWCTRTENANHSWKNGLQKKITGKKNHMFGRFGKKHHNSKKVYQFNKDGTFIKKWDSLMDINRSINISAGHISSCCKGDRYSTGGYRWSYTDKLNKIPTIICDRCGKEIIKTAPNKKRCTTCRYISKKKHL